MVSIGGKKGRMDNNRDESAANRNREPVGELARARPYATHWDRGQSHPDAGLSANMPSRLADVSESPLANKTTSCPSAICMQQSSLGIRLGFARYTAKGSLSAQGNERQQHPRAIARASAAKQREIDLGRSEKRKLSRIRSSGSIGKSGMTH